MQPEEYDSLVSGIYASSYQANGWSVAFERMRQALGLDAFALMRFPSRFAGGLSPEIICVGGTHVTPGAAQRYDAYYGAIDPRNQFVREHSIEDVFLCEQHFDPGYVSRSEFYQDFLRPEGLRFCMGTCIRLADQTDFTLGLLRSEDRGSYAAETQQVFRRLIGHLKQTLEAYERLAQAGLDSGRVMDTISWGAVYLDKSGRFIGCNRLFDAMLVDGELVRIQAGVLNFRQAATQHRFARSLQANGAATFLAESASPEARRFTMTLLPVPTAGDDRTDLPPASRTAGARWVGILAPLDRRRIPSTSQLMDVFGLAPAEARLARALASGDSLGEYADANSLTMNTVRTQLRAVFRKTGTERQAQVVQVLNNIPATRQ